MIRERGGGENEKVKKIKLDIKEIVEYLRIKGDWYSATFK